MHVSQDFLFLIAFAHFRVENEFHEALEFEIVSRDVSVTALGSDLALFVLGDVRFEKRVRHAGLGQVRVLSTDVTGLRCSGDFLRRLNLADALTVKPFCLSDERVTSIDFLVGRHQHSRCLSHDGRRLRLQLFLESLDGELEKFVLPLRFQHLFVQKFLFLLEVVGLRLESLQSLVLLLAFSLDTDLVVAVRLDDFLEHIDFFILQRIVAVLKIELFNHITQVFLLALDVDVVSLEVFEFLLSEHIVQFIIEVLNLMIEGRAPLEDFCFLLLQEFLSFFELVLD